MVATARALRRHRCLQELLLCNGLDVLNLIQSLHRRRIPVLVQVHDGLLQILICLVEEVLLRARLSIIARGDEERVVMLQVTQSVEDLKEFESTYFVFLLLPRLSEISLCIAKQRGARSTCEISVDSDPLRFELGLDQFEAIEWAHVVSRSLRHLLGRRSCALHALVSAVLSHLLLLLSVRTSCRTALS